MKNSIINKTIIGILLIGSMLIYSNNIYSQNAPPPPGNHGQQGGSAPIGSGLGILLALGAIYGAKKIYNLNKTEKH
mgnify:CR=1 FL=1|jgi:hypothetical protein